MKEFKMHTNLMFVDCFAQFVDTEQLGTRDFILTNEFLYQKFIQPLKLPCGVAFLEQYGAGEPTNLMVDQLRADLPSDLQRMIAVGGGAVMDTAKMLSLHTADGKTETLFDLSPTAEKPRLLFDVYAVPTTCGTGSEVTNACAVELVSLHTKRGLNNDLMFAKKAILIPELLYDLPYQFFATSSIDALIHAVEAYLSPKASPISQLFSREAISMIVSGYLYVVNHGKEKWVDRAEEFQIASTYAGLAFCSAGCAAVHALSYPLGGGYHIPHGEANQLVFAATFRKYKAKQPVGSINQLEELLGTLLSVSPQKALESAFALFDQVQPRKPLREFGITAQEFQDFAEGVMAGQTRLLNNNYTALTVADMVDIYETIY